MSYIIRFEDADYEVYRNGCCKLYHIAENCINFRVTSEISTSEGKRYRVTGISSAKYVPVGSASMISFSKSTEIAEVPVSFIGRCRSFFTLPPKVKRVTGSGSIAFPKVDSEKRFQRFVSISGSRVIVNHFPLEIAYQHSRRQRFNIRETVRFVGDFSFNLNESIYSVLFPSSVEHIGDLSFYGCKNLRFILFKKNSKLKMIGKGAFKSSSLESAIIPLNVEEIGECAFSECRRMKLVTFHENPRLKIIGKDSFSATSLEVVNIPSNVEEIREGAFSFCMRLKSVHYLNEAKIRKINENAFANCPNLNH